MQPTIAHESNGCSIQREAGCDQVPRCGACGDAPQPARGRMGTMPLYRDEAIVLRTHKLGEADRIITMLTRTRGRVRAVAKGVRRTKSRFGSRLEPGMVIDVQCYEGRNLDTVTQVETLAPYGDAIARDYAAYTCATSMLETALQLTEEHEPQTQQYLLL